MNERGETGIPTRHSTQWEGNSDTEPKVSVVYCLSLSLLDV